METLLTLGEAMEKKGNKRGNINQGLVSETGTAAMIQTKKKFSMKSILRLILKSLICIERIVVDGWYTYVYYACVCKCVVLCEMWL